MMTITPARSIVKNNAPIQAGDCFGLAFGGGCLRTLFDRLFGMGMKIAAQRADNCCTSGEDAREGSAARRQGWGIHASAKGSGETAHLRGDGRSSVRRMDPVGHRVLLQRATGRSTPGV